MPAYSLRSVGTLASGTGTLTPGLPAGRVAGDLLLTAITCRSAIETFSTPTGWTLLVDTSFCTKLYGRICTADGNDAFSNDWSGSNSGHAQMSAWSGNIYTTMASIVAHNATGGSSSNTANCPTPALTVSTANCLIIAVGKKHKTATSDGAVITNPTDVGTTIAQNFANGSPAALMWSYIQQTTATNIGAGTFAQSIAESLPYGSLVAALQTNSTPAPTFSVSPTVTSQTASAYTIGYTADANATNLYVGSYLKDATAPTAAQLKAGTNAHGTATEATTGSSDSIVLTPSESTKFPIYDIYAVLEGAGGFSSVVALVDEMLDPPAGKQFVTLASVSGTSPLTGASPTIVAGDIWVLDTTSTPSGYTITPDTAGDFVIDSGGDSNRQSFAHDVYDVSAGGYYGAGTVYVNNQAPNLIGGPGTGLINGQVFKKSENQGTIALSALVEDTEGDSFTFAVQSGALPTSWSLASNGNITDPPTVYGDYSYVIRITDAIGDYLDVTDSAVIGDEMPNVVDEVQATAITDIEAVANFTVTIPVSTAYSASILLGHVISQDPAADEYVADGTTVTLTVSLGAAAGALADSEFGYRRLRRFLGDRP